MGQLLEFEKVPDLRCVFENADDPAIVGLEELPQHQDCEDLGLCEIVS